MPGDTVKEVMWLLITFFLFPFALQLGQYIVFLEFCDAEEGFTNH